jgi:hypothetical protein
MKQLELLKHELTMLLDNIERIEKFKEANKSERWKPSQSNVGGELKHRIISMKQRMTLVSRITTSDLFN